MNRASVTEVAAEFQRLFHIPLEPFFSAFSCSVYQTHKIIIPDFSLLDKYFTKHYKEEYAGVSMREIIRRKYGDEAVAFIKELISE